MAKSTAEAGMNVTMRRFKWKKTLFPLFNHVMLPAIWETNLPNTYWLTGHLINQIHCCLSITLFSSPVLVRRTTGSVVWSQAVNQSTHCPLQHMDSSTGPHLIRLLFSFPVTAAALCSLHQGDMSTWARPRHKQKYTSTDKPSNFPVPTVTLQLHAASAGIMNLAVCRSDLKRRAGIGLNLEHSIYSGSGSTRVWKAINCTLCELRSPCSIRGWSLAAEDMSFCRNLTMSNGI